MGKIILYDWNIGMNKVGLTKLLRSELGRSLSKAKSVTDAVVKRQPITIELANDKVETTALRLDQLGVKFVANQAGGLEPK
jgi:hypothetical protein